MGGNWKRESGVPGCVRSKTKFEGQGESEQNDCIGTAMSVHHNDVRCRYMGSEEITICGGNEGVKLDECGVTKLDRIRNEIIRGIAKVREICKKVQESSLKWYGHVLRREEGYVGKRVMVMEVPWKTRR